MNSFFHDKAGITYCIQYLYNEMRERRKVERDRKRERESVISFSLSVDSRLDTVSAQTRNIYLARFCSFKESRLTVTLSDIFEKHK